MDKAFIDNPNRRFDIYNVGDLLHRGFSPSLLQANSLYDSGQFLYNGDAFYTLNMTHGSILPPLINTFEVYSLIRMENFTADSQDAYSVDEQHLQLPALKTDLNDKNLIKSVYQRTERWINHSIHEHGITGKPGFVTQQFDRSLVGVTFCGVPHFSSTKPQQPHCRDTEDYAMYEEETPLHIDIRRFTYAELKHITNDFNSIVGKGGFGTVYHGTMENADEVAVKVLMETSIAESTDFLPEVQTLSKVHHKNLVTLQGYCQNKCLALIYDFMPRGNLQQLLREGEDYSLNWEQRLHIALGSAQGLEYLHESCTPSIVHRDVKTANILLDKNLVGIIADFGLSRAFNDAHTHISTVAAGTLGYLDPEYHATFQLTTKTDVYSFGIVLLEIITGKPPVLMDPQTYHLPNWVRQKIAKGSIQDIVDKKLLDQYDTSSLQSVVDLAMNCVESAAMDRPTMTEVVSRLKVLLPTVPSEKQYASASSRCTNSMDAEMRRQFQLLISEERNEESSFRSGYTGGMPELNPLSGR
ncbi:probable leucine-rich repeat receptor-like protein kinase At2g28990 [Triticum dicoccoides]|uniref:probable leucine-rich repeat receptor-like protein kinase At2g28990 n=1 Tax=Triticum dicoccoides TaxID=85692 RepID=UPI00188FCCFF|nr:probable leucine-rich repeat receptor-like protein kinase At2g28990 [Triticum dicoccoides]